MLCNIWMDLSDIISKSPNGIDVDVAPSSPDMGTPTMMDTVKVL